MFSSMTPKVWIMIITAFALGVGVGAGVKWAINSAWGILERIFK